MDTKQILAELDSEIAHLTQARALLAGTNSSHPAPKRRTMSAESRKHIADAQRKRWAKVKKLKKLPGKTKPPRLA
jgi:uncharacterized protein YaiL (DUF2058 family)